MVISIYRYPAIKHEIMLIQGTLHQILIGLEYYVTSVLVYGFEKCERKPSAAVKV